MQAPDPLRWGIVGTGAISNQITSDLRLVDDALVVAVSSRTMAGATAFADHHGLRDRFDDYGRMLKSGVDAVYIGTPHVTHFDLAREALESGRHVLCEKPIGLNATEVRELAAIAARSGAFLMEAMWMKFNPLFRRLQETVAGGAIGQVRSVRGEFGAPFPQDGSSRWKPGGSTLLDQGIYPVTLAHLFLGDPSGVTAGGTRRDDGVDLRHHFTLDYPDGRFAQGAASMVEYLDQAASISGSAGWISIDPGFWFASHATLCTAPGGVVTEESIETFREGHGYVPMLREVTAAIRRGAKEHPLHTLDATARTFDTLDAIRRSIIDA